MIFPRNPRSHRSTDRLRSIPPSQLPFLLLPHFFSRHLKQILKFSQENVRSDLCAILAHRDIVWPLYVDVVTKLDVILKMLRSKGTSQAALFVLLNARRKLPSSDRSIEVSRPARILDTIDCRHPASQTTARGSFNRLLLFLLFLVRAGLTNLSVLAFELNVCELPLFLLPSHIPCISLSLSIFLPHIRTRSPLLPFPPSLLSLSSSFLFLPYQAEGGSGHERAATLLDSDAVTGAEVRRISIGFEPDAGGRPKTP